MSEIPPPLFQPGETLYYAHTRITATIKSCKYFGPADVEHAQGIWAQIGWRYELVGSDGLYYFQWQFSREPSYIPTTDNENWRELAAKYPNE